MFGNNDGPMKMNEYFSLKMTDLFPATLISPQVQNSIKTGFKVRPLNSNDYDKGFLKCLGMLTTVGDMSKKQFLGACY